MSKDTLEIKWQCVDGYAGGDAPHAFKTVISDYIGMSKDEITEELHSQLQNEFEQTCSYYCRKFNDYVEEIEDLAEAMEKQMQEEDAEE